MQKEQCLHVLIQKIKQICIGFDDHKQDVYNLVQVLKGLFLYSQSEKELVEEYGRNLKSLWDTAGAFGGPPGLHKGMVDTLMKTTSRFEDPGTPTKEEMAKVKNKANKVVKAALLISGADKQQYRNLKNEQANNYLLGRDQYPNTYKKAMQILGNYQGLKSIIPFQGSPNDTGVAFLQRGGRSGCGGQGQGRQGKVGDKKDGSAGSSEAGDNVSMMTGKSGDSTRTNSKGESHCFHCRAADHWAYKCPELTVDQQGQLHMNLQEQQDGGEVKQQQGHQLLNIVLMQGGTLPNNQAYLDGCSTVTIFKNDKYLKGVTNVREGIKIDCYARTVSTNLKGNYGRLKMWYLSDGIANIFSMHELEQLYCIMYNSWEGLYIIHTLRGEVSLHKDNQGLPFIDLDGLDDQAAVFLLQMVEQQGKEKKSETPAR
jgi:hypothetical protein